MSAESPKKPKVLKRKGREVEEALLFEDQMDEAALEEWERKMGLHEEEDSETPVLEEIPESSEPSGENLSQQQQTHEPPTEASPKGEASWRQSGKLRWLGLAGVRLYLEEKSPVEKSLFMAASACVVICLAFVSFLWTISKPQPEVPTPEQGPQEMVLDLVVPLKEGRAGLWVSLSLELEETGLQSWEVRRELLELIREMDPGELLGDQGISRLRASMAQRLSLRWPWVKKEGIRFLQYLIL
ncbi:MAG: flagellar basal body-associated FliL family protein [bacterium]